MHHHYHYPGLDDLAGMLRIVIRNQEKIMATLDQVLAEVTEENTLIDSLSTLIDGLHTQVTDALSGTTLPAPVQAKVDAIFTAAENNKAKLTAAVKANTPGA